MILDPNVFKHYILGIPEVDDDHLEIIHMMVQAAEHSANHDNDSCTKVLEGLHTKLKRHEALELELMERYKYPHINMHLTQHTIIEHKLIGLILMTNSQTPPTTKFLTTELQKLFVAHADHYDRQYAEWILSKQ